MFTFDLSSVIAGANMSARGDNPIFHHPNTCSISYVTQSGVVALAAKGMDSKVFGHLKINVFGTLEEALAHVRALA